MDYIDEIKRRIANGEYVVNSEQLAETIIDKVQRYRDRIRAKEAATRAEDRRAKDIQRVLKAA